MIICVASYLAGKIAVWCRTRSFLKIETLKIVLWEKVRLLWIMHASRGASKSQIIINCSVYKVMLLELLLVTLIKYPRYKFTSFPKMGNCVQERCDDFSAILVFKAIHGLITMYMIDNSVMTGRRHDRDTKLFNSIYHPIIEMRSNGYSCVSTVSPGTISLMKSGWLPMCQISSGGTSVLSSILCLKKGWCLFVCKLTENRVHVIRHFIPMLF